MSPSGRRGNFPGGEATSLNPHSLGGQSWGSFHVTLTLNFVWTCTCYSVSSNEGQVLLVWPLHRNSQGGDVHRYQGWGQWRPTLNKSREVAEICSLHAMSIHARTELGVPGPLFPGELEPQSLGGLGLHVKAQVALAGQSQGVYEDCLSPSRRLVGSGQGEGGSWGDRVCALSGPLCRVARRWLCPPSALTTAPHLALGLLPPLALQA
jgi:hypothetical protein